MHRRGRSSPRQDGENQQDTAVEPAPQLRAPRHGGWKGFRSDGREAQMLRGEPGYHLGIFRVGYGALLVQRTLAFMSSGAVDASFARGESLAASPGGAAPLSVANFGHGFLLLGGDLANPTADAVRSACWCLCAAGVAISVGFRPNAMAFAASLMQLCLLLLEKSVYTDEAYLFALMGLLLSCTECGKTLGLDAPSSEDADQGGRGGAPRDQPPDTVPHWHVVLLRFQICIVHIHRGLAKAATLDWLIRGQPLLHTLETMPPMHLARRAAEWAAASEIPGFGGGGLQALAVRANGTAIFVDLFLGLSLLAAPHYRPAALILQTAIHLAGAIFGGPGTRAWHLLIVATGVLFVNPATLRDRIEAVQTWLQPAVSYNAGGGASYSSARRGRGGGRRRYGSGGRGGDERAGSVRGGGSGGGGGGSSGAPDDKDAAAANGEGTAVREKGGTKQKKLPLQPKPSSPVAALVSVYVLAQVLLPLRHVMGVFPVEWSREGHEFSWRQGGGAGGRGGSGGLVREESLVRVMHRPRGRSASARRGVQTVHLYGAPLTAQQVLRLVLDPDMLLQLAKKSSENSPAADRGRRGGGDGGGKTSPRSPHSHVDAWKSINGRPFARWIDPSVDVWDERFEGEGPSNAEWLQLPPVQADLDRAEGVMEAVSAKWAMKGQRVTFFAARPGQAGLSNVFMGAYDPSNFNTTELCTVPAPANAREGSAEGGGVLLGVAMGEVQLLTDPEDGVRSEPESRVLKVATGTTVAPAGRGHAVLPAGRGLAVWYYVHSCPEGLFHLCIGFLSGAGWEQLYPSRVGTRKGWTLEHGVPK